SSLPTISSPSSTPSQNSSNSWPPSSLPFPVRSFILATASVASFLLLLLPLTSPSLPGPFALYSLTTATLALSSPPPLSPPPSFESQPPFLNSLLPSVHSTAASPSFDVPALASSRLLPILPALVTTLFSKPSPLHPSYVLTPFLLFHRGLPTFDRLSHIHSI